MGNKGTKWTAVTTQKYRVHKKMTRYYKYFETKFRDQAAATDYATTAGWDYLGYKGLFRKYHEYQGTYASESDLYRRLRIYADGHTCLCGPEKHARSCHLPEWVYRNEYHYKQCRERYEETFKIVREAGYDMAWHGLEQCFVSAVGADHVIGDVVYEASSFDEVLKWIASHSNQNTEVT